MTASERSSSDREGLSRRSFLRGSAAAGLGIVLVGGAGIVFGPDGDDRPATGGLDSPEPGAPVGYGPLVADPSGVLALPAGFTYRVIAEVGVTRLTTGEPTPADPDGTGCFPRPGGGSVLVVNHEVGGDERNGVPALPGLTYDRAASGGTTTIEVDAEGNRIREYVSLAGTHNNCAGGVTPWGTWLSCEESDAAPRPGNGLTRRHGYVFEVDPHDTQANRDPQPIRALGRFRHEAVVVDPETFALYLTEDASDPDGLLYRWTPPEDRLPLGAGSLKALGPTDGVLEAMVAFDGDRAVADLGVAVDVGTAYRVAWTEVPDRDAESQPTRRQAYDRPPTRGRKLEGMWWGDGGAYVVSSFARKSDGDVADHDGQVWFLDPAHETITLHLRFAYTPADQDGDVDGPDNITVAPFGGVIIAENGKGAQHLIGATADGRTYPLARNEINKAEFTGPTVAADGAVLFANIQGDGAGGGPGYVFAITGPFQQQ